MFTYADNNDLCFCDGEKFIRHGIN